MYGWESKEDEWSAVKRAIVMLGHAEKYQIEERNSLPAFPVGALLVSGWSFPTRNDLPLHKTSAEPFLPLVFSSESIWKGGCKRLCEQLESQMGRMKASHWTGSCSSVLLSQMLGIWVLAARLGKVLWARMWKIHGTSLCGRLPSKPYCHVAFQKINTYALQGFSKYTI